MNPCPYQQQLFDWHDGRLSADQKLFMTGHLRGCQDCQHQLELWQQTAQLFLHPLRTASSEVFVHRVMHRVRAAQAEEDAQTPVFFARWTFPALALSMAGFAGALLYVAEPTPVSTDTLLQSSGVAAQGFATIPTTDQLLGSIVENP